MPQCAVATCRNSHRRTRKQSVRYHRFPHNTELRESWVRACGRAPLANGEPPFNIKTARICSRHFLEEFYEDESREQIMQGNQKRNRLRLGAVPTIDVPVLVEPCFKLLRETDKKRSATRVKISNIMTISNRPDTRQPCKRTHEDEEDEGSSETKTVSPVIKERAERNQKKRPKLDQQECFLLAIGLVHVSNVW
ncbi:hypothetical protein G5I_09225 [Acromyrmex echinatior]|uniref:THAP-type domain-containing protein n=1 Tax=Acromyrmex echinatior TaxID=103372 RepID=F4WTM0_ACREC|nr:hypothetical protein G5I_09225 [Acromyrmex echinatior]